jgi:hypothetical protein
MIAVVQLRLPAISAAQRPLGRGPQIARDFIGEILESPSVFVASPQHDPTHAVASLAHPLVDESDEFEITMSLEFASQY